MIRFILVTGITEFQDYFTVDILLEINNNALNSTKPIRRSLILN
jgi:hypothetical protein